jgi:hypothetical protein
VVPADDKDMCRYIIAEIIWIDAKIYWYKEPELDDKIKWILAYKDQLAKNKKGSEISEPFFLIQF